MNSIFKYNANAKYSTKDLKGEYNRNNFSLLDVYLNEKEQSVKIQLPNIFKDHHIVSEKQALRQAMMNGRFHCPLNEIL